MNDVRTIHYGITESYINAIYLCNGKSGSAYLHRADVEFSVGSLISQTLALCPRCTILVAAALAAGCELAKSGQFKVDPRPRLRDLGFDV